MKKLRHLFNHKVRYPGSVSYYQTTITVGSNAQSQKALEERLDEIRPGLERYLRERGFILMPKEFVKGEVE